MKLGHQQKVLESPRVHNGYESFRRSESGISTDRRSVESVGSKLSSSPRSGTRQLPHKGLKEFAKKFVDKEAFTIKLQDWLSAKTDKSLDGELLFNSPFQVEELRKFDYALEGVVFQQLLRMPCASYVSSSGGCEADAYLAVEDFLHTSAESLWRTFWHKDGPMPFFISCPYGVISKFHTAEKAIVRGKVGELCGAALIKKNGRNMHGKWDHVAELALFKDSIGHLSQGREPVLSVATIGEALFYGFHMLLSRSLSKSNVQMNNNCVYVLVLDSEYGGVVKLSGDLMKLDSNVSRVYDCAVDWIQHAEVKVSHVDRIWNKLGNANWGDFGTLQLLLATFYSIVQYKGPPKFSIAELAANHSIRLQKRRIECRLTEVYENGSDSFHYHQSSRTHGEIVEIEDELEPVISKEMERMKLEVGSVIWLEDSQCQRGFQIHEVFRDGQHFLYSATSLEEPGTLLAVCVGAHPSQLQPSWEDMSMWYQVQRQTKVLNIMKQRGISSKYLPQLVDYGRVVHPGSCYKQSPGGRCNHPWCGTPVLVTSPVGEPLSTIITRDSVFTSEDALQCCHDILSALQSAASASIQHGDICPEHVMRVSDSQRHSYYVLVDWGHAVLEDRDSPSINLQFSSTYALQEGKLCPASDAESLVYLLYHLCGGIHQQLESIEAALRWRERSWAKRRIQQQLGEVSALLKAFADYVDSLCGTPYPVDYEIWLKRLSRALPGNDHGKMIDYSAASVRSDDVAESSGTSAASLA